MSATKPNLLVTLVTSRRILVSRIFSNDFPTVTRRLMGLYEESSEGRIQIINVAVWFSAVPFFVISTDVWPSPLLMCCIQILVFLSCVVQVFKIRTGTHGGSVIEPPQGHKTTQSPINNHIDSDKVLNQYKTVCFVLSFKLLLACLLHELPKSTVTCVPRNSVARHCS